MKKEKIPKGVCKNCWNRGYSTELIGGTITCGDFEGEKDYKTKEQILIKFCNCENGKQLKSMFEEKIEENRKKWVEEWNCQCNTPKPNGFYAVGEGEGRYQRCKVCDRRIWD